MRDGCDFACFRRLMGDKVSDLHIIERREKFHQLVKVENLERGQPHFWQSDANIRFNKRKSRS